MLITGSARVISVWGGIDPRLLTYRNGRWLNRTPTRPISSEFTIGRHEWAPGGSPQKKAGRIVYPPRPTKLGLCRRPMKQSYSTQRSPSRSSDTSSVMDGPVMTSFLVSTCPSKEELNIYVAPCSSPGMVTLPPVIRPRSS